MDIPGWLIDLTAWAGGNRWMVWIFLIVLVTAMADLIQRMVVRGLSSRARRSRNRWDDAVLWALARPLGLLIWVLGISLAAAVAGHYTGTDVPVFDYIDAARATGVIVALGWFALRLIRAVELRMIERVRAVALEPDEGPDRSTVEAAGKLLRAVVLVTVGLVLLQTLGFSISGVLAFGGIGGIAVGFAARDMLANFFGGIMLHLDKPLAVGEWVRSPDREIEGTVEHISWRITRIRTFDMRPLYVPNSVFSNIAVENPSRMTHRRIYEIIGVRYADIAAMPAIVEDVRAMLHEHDDIDNAASLIVNFLSFGQSSLDIMVYCLTFEKRWIQYHAIKQDVMLEIVRIIEAHGAEIALPTSTLHVASLPGGEPASGADGDAAAAVSREPAREPGLHRSGTMTGPPQGDHE